ncbi:nucleotide sugar dehydrogenase [Arcobacter aquimarinus]|uniref:Polysaccharide biosynthesis protein, nucleotide sugar dehydrogenase, TviB family n=1 Tax=Arcobacter aquimarinus TaxID=1315211 RepID=A0AAE7E2K9_9BACT|nr:nucleotide sugar dehydrogenase [Arcobacter aquimarinus]QKE26756.1 polysaccharide biosynthesis protein, nucleotide sugar dehydrogenase, TviB family [Arcobacter aquimarinus]RXI34441.1 Vi polysaccharide biosynthesis protein VipA/TviB [Arcobacter aquimarinus]
MKDKICVIGLGYVGLPLAHAFSEKYEVVGFDINKPRIEELNSGFDRTLELNEKQVRESIKNGMKFTLNVDDIKDCNIYIVTVPTPIDDNNEPDLTPIVKSTETVGRILKKDDIVIYESTVYPGVTEEVCVPILERFSGLKFNETFFCGYSPERINPGDKEHTVTKILKITSGSTPKIAKKVDDLYKSIIIAGTHLAPTIKVAEAAKVIENTQRDVNIALINELAMIFDLMNINTHDVIEAAATKWNFIKLTPGLVGGHCIGVDPYYLTHKAQSLGYIPNLILGARQINNGMSKLIADKAIKKMVKFDKKLKNANVLVLGVTFKENCPDMRNSKVLDIIKELEEYECNVEVYDYWVDRSDKETKKLNFIDELPLNSKKYDSIIVAVGHDKFKEITTADYENMSNGKSIIIDVKGIVENPTWRL